MPISPIAINTATTMIRTTGIGPHALRGSGGSG